MTNISNKFENTQNQLETQGIELDSFKQSFDSQILNTHNSGHNTLVHNTFNHTHNIMALLYKIIRENIDNHGINVFIEFYGVITIHEPEIEWIAIGY
jgi:hypothetical protein